jgi:hypothetical protein
VKTLIAVALVVTVTACLASPAAATSIDERPSPGIVALVVVVLAANFAADAANISGLVRDEPRPVMAYLGLGTGFLILGQSLALDDGVDEKGWLIALGAGSTVLAGMTLYAASTRGKDEAVLAPLITPSDEGGVSVGAQLRFAF